MGFIYSIIGFLIAIAILVTVHEFGHYWVAKRMGVKVLRFSVGFGKPLLSWVAGKDRTEYVVAAIPLGGYVKMLGEGDDDYSPAEQHRTFDNAPIWRRSLIVLAGPLINFLFAIVIYLGLNMVPVQGAKPVIANLTEETLFAQAGVRDGDRLLKVDGKDVAYMGQHRMYVLNKALSGGSLQLEVDRDGRLLLISVPLDELKKTVADDIGGITRRLGMQMPYVTLTEVGRVVEGTPAANAGIQAGDKLLAVNDKPVTDWPALVDLVVSNGVAEAAIQIERDGEVLTKTLAPQLVEVSGQQIPRIGIGPKVEIPEELRTTYKYPIGKALLRAIDDTYLMSAVTLKVLGKIITLQASPKNISGPITIADSAGQALQISFSYYLYVLAVISISLGIMNLLPIPMLDGGHLLFYAAELVNGKPLPGEWHAVGQKIGLILLACLMSLAFYNDIFRLLN